MGMLGSVVSVGLMLGPPLGGLLVGLAGWHAIFTINLPIGVVGALLAVAVLKDDTVHNQQKFDVLGAVLLTVSLVSLTLGLTQGSQWGWQAPETVTLLVVAALSGAAFVFVEKVVKQPTVDLNLFRNRTFAANTISLLLSSCAVFVTILLMPFYLQDILALSPQQAGMVMSIVPIVMFVVAPVAGLLSDRIGPFILASSGLAIAAVGLALVGRLSAQVPLPDVIWRSAVLGLGFGLFGAPNSSALMGAAPRERYGVAGSMMALMRNMGMAIGLSLGGAAFTWSQAGYLSAGLPAASAFMGAFQDTFLLATGLCVLGVIASLAQGARPAQHPGLAASARPSQEQL